MVFYGCWETEFRKLPNLVQLPNELHVRNTKQSLAIFLWLRYCCSSFIVLLPVKDSSSLHNRKGPSNDGETQTLIVYSVSLSSVRNDLNWRGMTE